LAILKGDACNHCRWIESTGGTAMSLANVVRRVRAISACALLLASTFALAAPITYTFTGTGTGTVGATPFTNAAYTITLNADTTNITSFGVTFQNVASSATMTIAGIGTATITPSVGVFDNQGNSTIGFQNFSTFLDQEDGTNAAFATYALSTNIGPISGLVATALGQFVNLPSSLGPITLSASNPFTFQAALGGAPPPPPPVATSVPTLSEYSLLLLALLMALFAGLRLSRQRR
jgi:hypothetical protein